MEKLSLKPGRRGNVFGSTSRKALVVRPDSPKTREACLQLGYDPAIFKLKNIEDFAEPGLSDSVQRMRYEHYTQKTKNAIFEIGKARRDIIKKNQKLVNIQLEKDHRRDEDLANDLIEAYNRKMTKMKVDEDNASYESFDERDPLLVLEAQLDQEIKKYKKQLAVKAKEVQHELENEKKRHQLQTELEDREKKIQSLQQKLQEEKERKKKKLQKQAELKFKEIKLKERQQNQKQAIARKQQLEEFEKLRNKLREEEEKKRKEIEEQEKKQQEKYKEVMKRKLQNDEYFSQRMSSTMNDLQLKQLHTATNRNKLLWESKLEKLSMRLTLHDKRRTEMKMKTEKLESMKIQSMVMKLVHKEEDFQQIQQKRQEEETQKFRQEAKKRKKITESLKLIKSEQLKWVRDLEHKFKQLDDKSKQREAESTLQAYLKKEKQRMKQQDLKDNYERQERLKDFRFKQVIKDNQQHSEQKSIEKLSSELVKKAQQELQKRLKKENEQLDASLMNVSQADGKNLNLMVQNLEKSLLVISQSV